MPTAPYPTYPGEMAYPPNAPRFSFPTAVDPDVPPPSYESAVAGDISSKPPVAWDIEELLSNFLGNVQVMCSSQHPNNKYKYMVQTQIYNRFGETMATIQHNTLGARGFLREEPQSGDKWNGEERRGEKISGWPRQLIDFTVPIDLN